jgi:hypothetical protein
VLRPAPGRREDATWDVLSAIRMKIAMVARARAVAMFA